MHQSFTSSLLLVYSLLFSSSPSLLFFNHQHHHCCSALLYPQQNERRRVDSLDGLWTFVREPPARTPPTNLDASLGFRNKWARVDLARFANATRMPVPCAYNEMGPGGEEGIALRQHVGWVWYQREHRLRLWSDDERLVLRFGSANYLAYVFVNGVLVGHHEGGHLPFDVEIGRNVTNSEDHTNSNNNNLSNNDPNDLVLSITVAVNNWLSAGTIPPGQTSVKRSPLSGASYTMTRPNFDFFPYAGLLRPVHLQHLPGVFIAGVRVVADAGGGFSYSVELNGGVGESGLSGKRGVSGGGGHSSVLVHDGGDYQIRVSIFEVGRPEVVLWSGGGLSNSTHIAGVKPWWPRGYGEPNLYSVEVQLLLVANDNKNNKNSHQRGKDKDAARRDPTQLLDVYRETFGFRTVEVKTEGIFINGRPFYCHGFGMHEDAELVGRAYSPAWMLKDFAMLEWLGANCYRTSHYPYSEERAYEADRRGFAVITEVSAVGLSDFTSADQLRLHSQMVEEMLARDANHPSVVAWSLANEPTSYKAEAHDYFAHLVELAHRLDSTRPVTIVYASQPENEKSGELVDFISFNRYNGWYQHLDEPTLALNESLIDEATRWRRRFPTKPLMLAEYGAEALPGLSLAAEQPFSEQYQVGVLRANQAAVDWVRSGREGRGAFVGEMVWNFADFMTAPDLSRANGNHKGVLTRSRQPKMSAYVVKERYEKMLRDEEAMATLTATGRSSIDRTH